MISFENITVRFGGVVALNAVSAELTAPVSGIIGPNGAGKTTLMNVVSGFVRAAEGQVMIDGQDFLRIAPHKRAQRGLRRSFQKEQIADDLTVLENVLVQTDWTLSAGKARRAEAAELLRIVGLGDDMTKPGAHLSGFERRLTDVARCLAGKPRLVMFDEPAGGLSVSETQALGELILRIKDLCGAQTVIIDHDVDLIRRICGETLVLDFGRRIALGGTAEVLADARVQAAYLGAEEVVG